METKLSGPITDEDITKFMKPVIAKRDKARARTKAWTYAPENFAYHHNRDADRWGVKGTFTIEEWNDLLFHTGYKCLACGNDEVLLVANHITPMSIGGSNYIDNIQPLCKSCHSKKHGYIKDYRSPETLKNLVRIGLVDLSRMIGR
jgi:5-methylcytosine-specific restriction endonuclease McrA